MLHKPASPQKEDNAIPYKTRLGVRMFIFYALIYAGFVVINITKPVLMEKTIVFGLNLAVVYGFGLIILSLIMALIYNRLCTKAEKASEGDK
ncbi:MAG: DUF485 domain-containing protein [Chloroflexi bacterium]|nr:DUF485 domain-containing protein [Chloroflexota bacterium]